MPASEKTAEELFFVHKDITDESSTKRLTRKELRRKPLKSEVNLKPSGSVDSSSDEEFDKSISYRAISEKHKARLDTRQRECPEKSTVHVCGRDLWSDGKDDDS